MYSIKEYDLYMNSDKQISLAVIKRLPRYYRYLGYLLENNITRISSMELSTRMNITASQIRQDLNNFGCFGQQGYGYNVELLYNEIKKILGLDNMYRMVILGAGNIGRALANYTNFEKRGFKIVAIFDNNPDIIGKAVSNLTVMDFNKLEDFIINNTVDIVVLAIRSNQVAEVASKVTELGVKGIWNFSTVDLASSENVQVENVHLTDSLMTLSYKLSNEISSE